MENVLFTTHQNGVAEMFLNQPKSINSLTYEMLMSLKEKLLAWENDPSVKVVILQGAGDKGFCAGGDMKMLYEAGQRGSAREIGEQFFTLEYEVDQMVSEFPKPLVVCLDGVVMGGGVGLSYGASHRIVTEQTKWAMPEMNIGFFPDVGAAYFLNRAPGKLGRYLALTSTVINGGEAIGIQAADHFIKREDLNDFIEALKHTEWQDSSVTETIDKLVSRYVSPPVEKQALKGIQEEVDEHFRFETVEEIVHSLESTDSDFAKNTAETLKSKSPISLKVTLKQLIDGQGKSFADCLATDWVLAKHFMENPDFFEGVRSVLIDKDHAPDYRYKKLSEVSKDIIHQYFE